jgi:predicted outer membrane repeat protein
MHTSIRLHLGIRGLLALLLTLALLPLLRPAPAHAAAFIVTTLDDSGAGSLREMIGQANAQIGPDTITFNVTGTIELGSTLPTISEQLTIEGPGASNLTISGKNAVGVFSVNGGALDLSGVTVANGNNGFPGGGGITNRSGTVTISGSTFSGNSSSSAGGAIYSFLGGTVTLSDSTFSGNTVSSGSGGAIYNNSGTVTVSTSTFSGNSSSSGGGAIYSNGGTVTVSTSTFSSNSASFGGGAVFNSGTLALSSSTFSGNSSDNFGGAIVNSSAESTVTISDSTFSGNSARFGGGIRNSGTATAKNTIIANSPAGGNCAGTLSDEGGNLSSDATCGFSAGSSRNDVDPSLGELQDNGGPTLTMALLPGSPAIDAAVDCPPPETDQRGVERPQDGNGDGTASCDIGAFELQVIFPFSGFFQPIDNLPTVNSVKAGQAIPVKFSLGGNYGLNIFAAGYPRVQAIPCDGGAPTDDIETVSAGGSGLTYDAASDTYTYVWKTQKGWAGTCRQLAVRLIDGSEHIASFQFR